MNINFFFLKKKRNETHDNDIPALAKRGCWYFGCLPKLVLSFCKKLLSPRSTLPRWHSSSSNDKIPSGLPKKKEKHYSKKLQENNTKLKKKTLTFNEIDDWLRVHAEIDKVPLDLFTFVLFLFEREHVMIEELLQTFVCVVDAY